MSSTAIAISILLPSIFVFLVLAIFCVRLIGKYSHKKLEELDNSVRSLIIDLKNSSVKFFNHNSLKNVRTMTLDQFCDQFNAKDNEKFRNWINSFFKNSANKPSDYLEIEVFMNRNHKKAFSVLKCVGIDVERKIIHIDSYLFLHLSTRTKHGYKIDDITLDEAITQLKYVPALKGSTICFKFDFINKNSTKSDINKLLFTQLKEVTLKYAYPPNRYLIEISSSEFVVLDLKSSDTNSSIAFVHQIISGLQKLLEINSVYNNTIISVGLVPNKYFPHKAKELIDKSKQMSHLALERNISLLVYDANEANEADKYSSEIDHIIKEHNLKYSFSPIYSVNKEKVVGYLSFVKPVNAPSNNIEEIYNRSLRADENKKLLTAILKDIIKLYSAQCNDNSVVLFRNLKFQDCKMFVNIISRNNKFINISPCFDEYDISYYIRKNADFLETIALLKDNNIYPCLKLTDSNLILESSIYSAFDYFIVYMDKINAKKNSETNQLSYRVVIEKLLKYNKPIILTRADGWSMVELLIRSGVEFISSNVIAPPDSTLPVISSKNILKMRKMLD